MSFDLQQAQTCRDSLSKHASMSAGRIALHPPQARPIQSNSVVYPSFYTGMLATVDHISSGTSKVGQLLFLKTMDLKKNQNSHPAKTFLCSRRHLQILGTAHEAQLTVLCTAVANMVSIRYHKHCTGNTEVLLSFLS